MLNILLWNWNISSYIWQKGCTHWTVLRIVFATNLPLTLDNTHLHLQSKAPFSLELLISLSAGLQTGSTSYVLILQTTQTHTGCTFNLSCCGIGMLIMVSLYTLFLSPSGGCSQIISHDFGFFHFSSFPKGNLKMNTHIQLSHTKAFSCTLCPIYSSHILRRRSSAIKEPALCESVWSWGMFYAVTQGKKSFPTFGNLLQVFHTELKSTDFTDTCTYRHVHTEQRKEAFWQAMSSWDLNVFLWWMLFCGFLTTIPLFSSIFSHFFVSSCSSCNLLPYVNSFICSI